jgi:hypothetical protein
VQYDQADVRFIRRQVKLCFRRGDLGRAPVQRRPRQMKVHRSAVKFVRRAVQYRGSRWHCLNCAGNQLPTPVHQQSYFFDFPQRPADVGAIS